MKINYVVASHKEDILKDNFLKSEVTGKVVVQRGYKSITKAYNEAKIDGDIIVYAHHDIYLPINWEKELLKQVAKIKKWDVLGIAGVIDNGEYKDRIKKGWLMDRGNEWGHPIGLPAKVETLDECLLITKGNIKFDEKLKFHFYGADICLGKKAYAIKAFCYHNSGNNIIWNNKDFMLESEYMLKKHKRSFTTTCGKFNYLTINNKKMKLKCIADCKLKDAEVKEGQTIEVEKSLCDKAIKSGCFIKEVKVKTTDIKTTPKNRQMKPRRRRK